MELFRVDLSRVVSKWIGETEKNLGKVFDEAQRSQRDHPLRRGRLAVRQAHRGQVVGRSLRQPGGELPAAAHGGVRRRHHPHHQLRRHHRHRVQAPPDLPHALREARRRRARRAVGEGVPAGVRSWPTTSTSPSSGARFEMSGGNIRNAAVRAAFLAAAEEHAIDMDTIRAPPSAKRARWACSSPIPSRWASCPSRRRPRILSRPRRAWCRSPGLATPRWRSSSSPA